MTEEERKALAALRFNWALTPDDVWGGSQFHVEGLHQRVEDAVLAGVRDARASTGASPIGLVIQGQKGVGKTHLLGWVRQQVQQEGGYFFLVKLMEGNAFWKNTAIALTEGLFRDLGNGTQLTTFLDRLAERAGTDWRVSDVHQLDEFVGAVRKIDRQAIAECQDVLRALVLFASDSYRANAVGEGLLTSMEEINQGERDSWGIRPWTKQPQTVVKELTKLLALTGPIAIAVDQIDQLVAASKQATGHGEVSGLFVQVAGGLMDLREHTNRTLPLVACLPHTWETIKRLGTDTVSDRFREVAQLLDIPSTSLAWDLVVKRLGVTFQDRGFTPPHPTWPIDPRAFEDIPRYTPRKLLQRIEKHVQWCLQGDEIVELDRFDREPEPVAPPPPPSTDDLSALDARFAELRQRAEVRAALDQHTEDEVMPGLISAALAAWIAELGERDSGWKHDSPPSVKPALHARLIQELDEESDSEAHWAFRAIAHTHPRWALERLRTARAAAGHSGMESRQLIILRNQPWARGQKTRQELEKFEEAGGRSLVVTDSDLRTFAALKEMLAEQDPRLSAWLKARKPASDTELLGTVLPTLFGTISGTLGLEPEPERDGITFGSPVDGRSPVSADLESLRMHTFIVAGSGSGKTVLIRRLVEECALQGVSAIVLDPNNDLARLGDAWPTEPSGWEPGDAAKSKTYLANTEVVVWTPNRQAGRPLAFQPLPDFRSVLDSPDDFRIAVEVAVGALAPRAGAAGTASKAKKSMAVLREALEHYARRGERDLEGFIDVLADLPDGASGMANARVMAADMAEMLKAAMINDPMFGGAGHPADPAVLLTPSNGHKARISVISFVGLELDEQRQSFVSQLQMELFSWVKRNPANDRPLGWLLVMDEAQIVAPSGKTTPSTSSTLMLASQARKYGLGLVFATQAPKGLHNRIPGNAATQFYGRLGSPAHIKAAEDMARAKGSLVQDISRLERGNFFVATDSSGFRKVRMPMCLSHHPPTALTPDEVIDRARA